jgi:tRNA (guanine37-N1)-methyltransferase
MHFDIITIFPHLFDSFLNESLIKKSALKGVNDFVVHDLRKWTSDKHKTVDGRPYGGGAGMLMMAEPIIQAIKEIKGKKNKRGGEGGNSVKKTRVILFTPTGKQFDQNMAEKFLKFGRLILICGRYEGVDERIKGFVDEKVSIGPYVLSGGETPAMVMMEAISRLEPGYLGNKESLNEETFNQNMAEYPQYTRPETIEVTGKKLKVPKVLLSGDHLKIKKWRDKNRKILNS